MIAALNDTLVVSVLTQAVVYGTPILFAALGELLAERSGVLNLGVEGMMLIGAVMGFWASQHAPGPAAFALFLAVLMAAFSALAVSLIHAFLTITLRASQIVSGLALTIFCGGLGLSSYLGNTLGLADVPPKHQFPQPRRLRPRRPPGGRAGALRPVGARLRLVARSSPLIALYLTRTRLGLNVRVDRRGAGRGRRDGDQRARATATRTCSPAARSPGSAAPATASAITPGWTDGDSLVGGAGWIAIALVIFAFWRPELCLVGAYLFGGLSGGLPSALQAHGYEDQAGGPERASVHHDHRRARPRLVRARAPPLGRARRARHCLRARGALMDVVSPRSLDEALRVKAEHPDARADPGRHRRAWSSSTSTGAGRRCSST